MLSKTLSKKTLFAALIAAFFAQTAAAEDRAVIIGINEYAYLKDGDLNGATVDAQKFKDFVRRDLGLKESQITLLLDGAATRKRIIDTIVADLKFRTKPGDRFILFFAGHGSSTKDRDGDEPDGKDEYILTADAGKKGVMPGILDDEIRYMLEYFQDREILVVVDACYSGTIARNISTDDDTARTVFLGDLDVPDLPDDTGLRSLGTRSADQTLVPGQNHMDVWSATSAAEVAIENRSGGIFTKLFLEGVGQKKADFNRNGVVTNAELLAFVRQGSQRFCRTSRLCQDKNRGRLTPGFSGAIERTVAFTPDPNAPITPKVEASPTITPQVTAPPVQTAPVTAPAVTNIEVATAPASEAAPVTSPNTQGADAPDQVAAVTPTEEALQPETQATPEAVVPTIEPTAETTVTVEPPSTTQPDPEATIADAPQADPAGDPANPADPAPTVDTVDVPQGGDDTTPVVQVEDPPDVTTPVPPIKQTPAPAPLPLAQPFRCDDLRVPAGTAKLEDVFLPSRNQAVQLSIRQGVDLAVGQTVLFDVGTDRGGRLMVFDLTPGCELYQVFPSVISPADAPRLTQAAQIEIPSVLSANGQPMVIRVSEPVGRGHLLAVLLEDRSSAIDSLVPPQSQLAAIPDGIGHLTKIANGLNDVVTGPDGAQGTRWHATIVPYTISR